MIKYKKNIYLFLFLLLLIISWNQVFWKWKYNGNNIGFSLNSWTNSCPTWEEIVDTEKNKKHWTAWSIKCMLMDKTAPVININWNSYISWQRTNKDVSLNINITDDKLWVKNVEYIINWEKKTWSISFSLSFTEEWTYNINVIAEDNSTNESPDWSSTTVWNKSNLLFVVKIDKSNPVLNLPPVVNSNWVNNKPIISFNIKDTYKWKNVIVKTFTCTWKPLNSTWIRPVEPSWSLVGTCDDDLKNCSIDANFIPYPNDLTQWCNWVCDDWYIKWLDNQCHKDIITENCWVLPAWKYKYNTSNILVQESIITSAYWILPTWVANNWDFLAKYDLASWLYSPGKNQCSSECESWYHFDSSELKCIADTSLICCGLIYPLTTSADIAWSSLNGVDCNNPINSTNVKCVYNTLCWWYVKDILKYWENSTWKYETEWVKNLLTEAEACWFQNIPNSDWKTCNSRFYLINWWTATQSCESVPIWEWSKQENDKHICTNKPKNSYYTSNWDNDNCDWACNNNYNKNWTSCKADDQEVSCTPKPINTNWNNVDKITQEWNWNSWTPTNISTYNINWSNNECRFDCKSWYLWDRVVCYKPACNSWETYNSNNKKCEKVISYSCNYTASENTTIVPFWYWDCIFSSESWPTCWFCENWVSDRTANAWECDSTSTSYSCPNWWTLSWTTCIKICSSTNQTSPNCTTPVYSDGIWKCY